MFSTLEYIFMFLCTVLNVSAYYRLLSHKLEYRFSLKTHIPAYLICSPLCFGIYYSSDFPESSFRMVFQILFCVILFFLYNNTPIQKIFWMTLCFFTFILCELLFMPVDLLLMQSNFNRIFPLDATSSILTVLSLLLAHVVITLFIRGQKIISHIFFKDFFLIILVDVAYTVILSSSFIIGTVKLSTNLAIALSLIALYIISFLALFLLGKITRKSEELMNTSLRLQQMEIEHKQTQDMAILVDDLRALRHDMNNHMSILQGLLSMKEYEDASVYLSGIVEELSLANSLVFPDNKVLSILLNSKIGKARQLGITFETEILTSSTPFSDLDLCAVIGNVIENAIEASSKHAKPYIFFSIQKSNHTFLLQCDNTYTVMPIFEKGNPVTTKAEKRHHGLGTKNIRSIVEAYHGTCSFDADDLFHVNISVPL